LSVPAAPFVSRWCVRLADGQELRFSEPVGNRLLMRKLIDRHFGRETGQPHAHRPVRASGDAGGEAEAEAASALEGRIGAAYPKQKREAFDARYNEFTAATAQLHRKPLEIPLPRSQPTKREILDGLQTVKIAVSPMMRCWQDGIPAEVRAEIMTEAYELVNRL
jgi:hypothetical protein